MSETKMLLIQKLVLVKPGANIYGGGIWKKDNDLNWAFQQMRDRGKPAGDVPKYNQKAVDMLNRFIPSLEPHEAGKLVEEIHTLTYKYIEELATEEERKGVSRGEALKKAREVAFSLHS